jgi:hypothetical protein
MIPSFPHVFSGNPGEFELDARLRHSGWPVWELDLFTQRHFNWVVHAQLAALFSQRLQEAFAFQLLEN